MTAKYIVFEDMLSLRKQLSHGENIYLVFNVGTECDRYLKRAVEECIASSLCKGIVFHADESRTALERLYFLKYIIEQLLLADKKVNMVGVPPCIQRALLGGYLYMRLRYSQAPADFIKYEEKNYLPICKHCLDKEICPGASILEMGIFKPVIKKNTSSLILAGTKPFPPDLVYLNTAHEAYVLYCRQKVSPVTYRVVYYVDNIDFSSEHSYENRFVYGCDYLGPDEYAEEFTFIKEHVIHKEYVDLLQSIASIEKTSQIAYSLAQKDGIFRESFYMFVPKQYGDKILHDFKVNYRYPESIDMQFIGIGVDVIGNETSGYKLYFQSRKSFLIHYLESYGIDISRLTYNSHYLVLRLDKKQRFVSYKIEILITHKDLKYFKHIIDNYEYFDKQLKQKDLYNIAIEVVDKKISKINIYHRHYFTESMSHDI